MQSSAPNDLVHNASLFQCQAMAGVIIGTIGPNTPGPLQRPPALAMNWLPPSINGNNWGTSCRLALIRMTLTGMHCAALSRRCLLPSARQSVGFGPVFPPCSARTDELPRNDTGQIKLVRTAKFIEQHTVKSSNGEASGTLQPFAKHAPGTRK